MANTDATETIYLFLKEKGLSAAAIAGVMGNLSVESGFSSTAYNAKEGAIGIAQWEGGRRTALQQYAAQQGRSETDLATQLGFLWQEVEQRGLTGALNSASNATTASSIWDRQFEGSAGTTVQQRANAANQIFGQLGSANANGYPDFSKFPSASGGSIAPVPPGPGGDPTSNPGALTDDQWRKQVGDTVWGLMTSIPELNGLLQQAMAGHDPAWLVQQVEQTNWWKTHSDTARQIIGQAAIDPASWNQNLTNQTNMVQQRANALGVMLDPKTAQTLANQALMEGWSQQTIDNNIGRFWGGTGDKNQNAAGGQAGQILSEVNKTAADYGMPMQWFTANNWVKKILTGQDNIDHLTEIAKQTAMSAYPTVSDRIKAGETMAQIADPYVSSYANLLEVNPQAVSWQKDPLIQKALQGQPTEAGKPPVSTPLWQFNQQVKQDPRWGFTDNAHAEGAQMLSTLGKQWGFDA